MATKKYADLPANHPANVHAAQAAAAAAQKPKVKYLRDTYSYSAVFPSLAPGADGTYAINIKADADFAWQKGQYMVDNAAASQTNASRIIPLVTILLVDGGSGRQLMDQALPLSSLFGIGELPFILPQPKVFARSSTLLVEVHNYDAATTYTNLYVTLHGTLLFPIVEP